MKAENRVDALCASLDFVDDDSLFFAIRSALDRRWLLDAAIAERLASAARHPTDVRTLGSLGDGLLALGRLVEAEAVFSRATKLDPANPSALIGLARAAMTWGDPQTALNRLHALLASSPDHAPAHVLVSDALRALGNLEQAEAAAALGVSLASRDASGWMALGRVRREARNFESALEAFERAAALQPGNANAHAAHGSMLCDMGRFEEGEAALQRALDLERSNLNALLGQARARWLQGDDAAARSALDAAAARYPAEPRIAAAERKILNGVGRFDWRGDIRHALQTVAAGAAPPRILVEACSRLLEYGLTDALEPTLSMLARRSPRARRIQLEARSVARSKLDWRKSNSPDGDEIGVGGFLRIGDESADTLIVVFAGREERLFIGLDLMHRTLHDAGAHLIYCRDLERTRYFGGVVGLGGDFGSTVEAIEQIAASLGVRRVLTIGTCVGAAAALRYGLEVRARGVLGIGPNLTPWEPPLTPEAALKLSNMRTVDPHFFDDISQLYGRGSGTPRVTLIFGEECARDAADARSMMLAPDVDLAGIVGFSEHNCLLHLLATGLLSPILQEFASQGALRSETLSRVRTSATNFSLPSKLQPFVVRLRPFEWF